MPFLFGVGKNWSFHLVFAKGIVHALPGGGAWAMPFLFGLVGGGGNSSSSNRLKRH